MARFSRCSGEMDQSGMTLLPRTATLARRECNCNVTLSVSPSAVSARVRSLESELGVVVSRILRTFSFESVAVDLIQAIARDPAGTDR
jgi:hypothetical protein